MYPWDLTSSIYTLLGINPTDRLPHPQGCVAYVTPPSKGDRPTGGLLRRSCSDGDVGRLVQSSATESEAPPRLRTSDGYS